MNELISVILPVYNGTKYLNEAIESILNQTYTNFEFIIINDGSKDNSLEIIRKYEQQDSRIIVISRENKGLIATLNEGIEKAKGKYIARMDQDDISFPERFEKQLKYIIENKLDICGSDYIEIDEDGNKICDREVFQKEDEIFIVMASNVPFAHPTVMMKRNIFIDKELKYGMNGNREAEDLDLWHTMWMNGVKFGNTCETLLKYRILNTSMSRVNKSKILKEVNRQFDLFIINNKDNCLEKIEYFCSFRNSDLFEKYLVKATLRYFVIYKKINIIIELFKSVKVKNFLFALASFLKMKVL